MESLAISRICGGMVRHRQRTRCLVCVRRIVRTLCAQCELDSHSSVFDPRTSEHALGKHWIDRTRVEGLASLQYDRNVRCRNAARERKAGSMRWTLCSFKLDALVQQHNALRET